MSAPIPSDTFLVLCAWCLAEVLSALPGDAETSHGICERCLAINFPEVRDAA